MGAWQSCYICGKQKVLYRDDLDSDNGTMCAACEKAQHEALDKFQKELDAEKEKAKKSKNN